MFQNGYHSNSKLLVNTNIFHWKHIITFKSASVLSIIIFASYLDINSG